MHDAPGSGRDHFKKKRGVDVDWYFEWLKQKLVSTAVLAGDMRWILELVTRWYDLHASSNSRHHICEVTKLKIAVQGVYKGPNAGLGFQRTCSTVTTVPMLCRRH